MVKLAIITNSITAVVIALATASLGGIFSSTATDMGTEVSRCPASISLDQVPS